jgi:hypothetical protein
MFTVVAPQRVRHNLGYEVRVASRECVQLIDVDGSVVSVVAEFGPVSAVYAATTEKLDGAGNAVPLRDDERRALAARIKEGLEAMGGTYETVD